MTSNVTVEYFEAFVKGTFTWRSESASEAWTLAEVKRLGAPSGPSQRIPFSLIFVTEPRETVHPQGTVVLESPSGNELTIFVVPIGRTPDGRTRLEAIYT